MFVEDPAVVVDEAAVITNLGAASRRGEAESIARALAPFRKLLYIEAPATLEGRRRAAHGASHLCGTDAADQS